MRSQIYTHLAMPRAVLLPAALAVPAGSPGVGPLGLCVGGRLRRVVPVLASVLCFRRWWGLCLGRAAGCLHESTGSSRAPQEGCGRVGMALCWCRAR